MDQEGPADAAWRIERSAGPSVILCDALSALAGVGHAFSTRVGPDGEEFDLGAHDSFLEPYERRRRRLCAAAGLEGRRPILLRQVHGARLAGAGEAAAAEPLAVDGVVLSRGMAPDRAAAVRTADCVPILLADSGGRAVAAVHAGWRGTAAGIALQAVALLGAGGIDAKRLVAAVGPSIGACCYEVGQEVVQAVAQATGVAGDSISTARGGRRLLDLARANRLQLRRAGVPAGAIHLAPWCTACRGDLFYSYRRSGGPTGRLMACIGLPEGNGAP